MFIASIGQDQFPYIGIASPVDMIDDPFLPFGNAPDDLNGGISPHLLVNIALFLELLI
jgi:hypothetical protein